VEAKRTLDKLEETVSLYKVQHNGELPQQESALNNVLGRLQVELEANRDAINRGHTNKVTLENSLSVAEQSLAMQLRGMERPAALETPSQQAPGIREPQQSKQSDILRAELKALRARYSDEHPDIVQLVNRINRVEVIENAEPVKKTGGRQAAVMSAETRPARGPARVEETNETRQTRERITTIKAQLELLDRELETRKTEQKRILTDIGLYQTRVNRLPIREQEMAGITRDYDIAKLNYRSLLDKKISADMAGDMERRQKAERFTIGDAARVPEKPARPNRTLFRGAGCAAGLVLGLVLGLAFEVRTRSLLGDWQIPAGIPVIARIPEITHSSLAPTPPTSRKRWLRRREAIS
jgi:uncharacterized protein involved in exopolysaccharide biosynthesis